MDILRAVVDDYVLGRSRSERLPMAAAEALCRGLDSPALRELAGLGNTQVREAGDLVRVAMAELGHPLRSRQEVLWDRVRGVARNLMAGLVEPPAAAGELAALMYDADSLDGSHIDREWHGWFEFLAVTWDDAPEKRHETADEIRRAAHDLLSWMDTQASLH